MHTERVAKRIVFVGRVQGVGFRFTSQRAAERFDLTGYVRNLPDGTVEMLAQGPPDKIEACLADVQDYFAGHIRETKIDELPLNRRYTDFRIAF